MASLTLTQCAKSAVEYLGSLDVGETLSTDMLDQAREVANSILDNWSSEGVMIPSLTIASFAFTANQQSYTFGSGGNFNTAARPLAVVAAALLNTIYGATDGLQSEIKVVDAGTWASIPDRGSSSAIVKAMFYDRVNSAGLGKVYFSPVPLGGKAELTFWAALTQFADNTTAITIPFGYELPFKTALAIHLAPKYDVSPTPSLVSAYQEAVARIRELNAQLTGTQGPTGQTGAVSQPQTTIQPQPN